MKCFFACRAEISFSFCIRKSQLAKSAVIKAFRRIDELILSRPHLRKLYAEQNLSQNNQCKNIVYSVDTLISYNYLS